MMVELWLIRHGMTPGNALGKYVGRTDEPLSMEGRELLAAGQASGIYPELKHVYVSPMKRCRETAAIIFPSADQHILEGMQECDFGDFEYKNYAELNGRPDYQAWIDSGGTAGFPGGETLTGFQDRVVGAFDEMTKMMSAHICTNSEKKMVAALVVHGGAIMAILDRYARPHRDYFEWQTKNGCGYVTMLDIDKWQDGERFLTVCSAIEVIKS